jgi:uncharacterized alkaline shock family protein YloU
MVDKEKEEVIDEAMSKMNQIRKAAGEFKENVAGLVKDLNVETKDWRFNVESHEEGVTIDVAVKLLISKKK